MEVEVNFNREGIGTEAQLLEMGAKKQYYDDDSDYYFSVTLNTMEDLEAFAKSVDDVLGTYHDLIIAFDHAEIFIDKL